MTTIQEEPGGFADADPAAQESGSGTRVGRRTMLAAAFGLVATACKFGSGPVTGAAAPVGGAAGGLAPTTSLPAVLPPLMPGAVSAAPSAAAPVALAPGALAPPMPPVPVINPAPVATPVSPAPAPAAPAPAPEAPAPSSPPAAPVVADPAAVVVESVLSDDQELHLLRRATFGLTAASVKEIGELGTKAWLDKQLDPGSIDDGVVEGVVGRFNGFSTTATQNRDRREKGLGQKVDRYLCEATIVRALFSNRQLFEKMVEFWNNHFNVVTPSGDDWGRKAIEDREVIRPRALGNFADLLVADAKSPAMMRFLNLEDSDKDAPNENYAREVMELHTLGVGEFTEDDVKQAALALTGYTTDDDKLFTFAADKHYVGPVTVLGWSSENATAKGGEAVGESLLNYLATHPTTARHICTKLARHFVSDTPPASLIDAMTKVFLNNSDSDTQIVPVLKALFTSPEFQASIGQKVRRPLESLTSAVRILDMKPLGKLMRPGDKLTLYFAADAMGHLPLNWAPPNGYPDTMGYWLSSVRFTSTWNRNNTVVYGGFPEHVTSPDDAFKALMELKLPITVGALLDQLVQRVLFQDVSPAAREALLGIPNRREAEKLTDAADARQLMQNFCRAIFDSPYFLQR